MFDREKFIDDLKYLAAREVPWRHQGSNPDIGVDCIGGLKWAFLNQGGVLPEEIEKEFAAYHRPPNGWHMLEVMRKWFIEITKEEMQPSDLYVIFNRKNPCHLAVKIDMNTPPLIAEAWESTGISKFMVWPLDSRRRIAACFRIPDFA